MGDNAKEICAYPLDIKGNKYRGCGVSSICKYFACVVAKETGRNCAKYKDCQTFKFYEKYGTESLWIGSIISPEVIRNLEEI